MISWRYHLISVVAVFLALGLGLLMGTALLNDRLVQTLRERTENAERDLSERGEQLARLSSFASAIIPFVLEDRLLGEEVVVITHEGVDDGAVADVQRALDQAGADVVAALALQPGLEAGSPTDLRALSELLGISAGATQDQVSAMAAEALAERLATGVVTGEDQEDLLALLLGEGFLVADDPELDSTTGIGGPGQAMVFVVGGPVRDGLTRAAAMMPLITGAAELGAVVAVGERTTASRSVVSQIRAELEATGPVVTVDDIDLPAGAAALILGIQQAIETGRGGDFGVGEDAQQLLPSAA